ncbi:glycosyltransferase [Arcanobacterium buesumense]|uniref:Glycosyltransferase n=1 Tax=Arcanobacterium buesumense TaxID=2722751 RepID=A0A6H2EHS6_9ACTO|nr:glycosyltransferase [Arcanobacterium buesumense]QJC21118.1 glycosyltransferase [Arcanobacterium buesumense]
MTKVSVILVNYRGAQDTIDAVKYLRQTSWPQDQLEIVIVENNSGDNSLEKLHAELPNEVIVDAGANLGFAGGCNLGVASSTGDVVAFLNNDARPDENWIAAAVERIEADPKIGCVASKVLNWEGDKIDYIDGSLTWFGMGYKREAGWDYTGQGSIEKNVLFATGAAMFVPRHVYEKLGGFDEKFFMFYEDVDFGWRVTLAGYDVRYVPTSIAYHRHHVSMNKFGNYRELYLLERNALACIYKNLGPELLRTVFAPAIALANERGASRGEKEIGVANADAYEGTQIKKTAVTGAYAVAWFNQNLEYFAEKRKEIQANRVRNDEEILPLMRVALEPLEPYSAYLNAHKQLVEKFAIEDKFFHPSRILVVTGDMLSKKMAGPAIRAWEMAKRLSEKHQVKLCSTMGVAGVESVDFDIHLGHDKELHALVEWADIVIFQGFLLEVAPWIIDTDKILITDIYDPMHLEQLEQAKDQGPKGRDDTLLASTNALNRQIVRGDRFLCASEKQRNFWLGQLAAMGRINRNFIGAGNGPESVIDIVPFGLDEVRPVQDYHAIKGKVPGISLDDKVILWGGGVYNWFDPLTLIRAVNILIQKHDNVRMYFLGVKHPNPAVPKMKMTQQAMDLADELGLTGKYVFFNHDWVDYDSRHNYLLDADCGVSTHFEHIETQYSFRTRILDYLWAGLPIVATEGDSFGNALVSENIGISVPPEDVDALAVALERVLFEPGLAEEFKKNIARYSVRFEWRNALKPLLDFVDHAHRADDRKTVESDTIRADLQFVKVPFNLSRDAKLVVEHLKAGGPKLLADKVRSRLRKLF